MLSGSLVILENSWKTNSKNCCLRKRYNNERVWPTLLVILQNTFKNDFLSCKNSNLVIFYIFEKWVRKEGDNRAISSWMVKSKEFFGRHPKPQKSIVFEILCSCDCRVWLWKESLDPFRFNGKTLTCFFFFMMQTWRH